MAPYGRVVTASAQHTEAPWFRDVLDTIAEFQTASIGLVAWELCLPEEALAPAWQQASSEGLIEEAGRCSETSEMMFQLAPVGVARSSRARERAAG